MTEFVKRIAEAINNSRRAGTDFINGEFLMALVPEAAHPLALLDIDNYMSGIDGAIYSTLSTPYQRQETAHSVRMMGVTCHIICSNTKSEAFVIARHIPQPLAEVDE